MGKPHVPADLIWLKHEPRWKAWAERRLKSGTKSTQVKLQYTRDYGVTASLKAALQKHSVELQANYTALQSTEWECDVTFAPLG